MGVGDNIGKYRLVRTIGEGSFAKVKLAVDTTNGQYVAIKIIDKHMIVKSNLKYQVLREIRTMKLLRHPNIVRIYEVLGTKTKIYIVMEYVPGGQLSDKMAYVERLSETETRKLFQQLIDAVDYCHSNGVYHRDLKPENLLLDRKGNLKVSDFGLSALRKQSGGQLTTACGSPCYVAPELLVNRGYDGAAADVWSCGVILFEFLAGYLPFEDHNLMSLYKKILKADYAPPQWFTEGQKKLLSAILEPNPKQRISISKIVENSWFQTDYVPSRGCVSEVKFRSNEVKDAVELGNEDQQGLQKPSSFINAFQLIAMSNDLDLSGLFEEQDDHKLKSRYGSKHPASETVNKIEATARDLGLLVTQLGGFKMKVHSQQNGARSSGSYFCLFIEVFEVAPTQSFFEVSKCTGEPGVYTEFCKRLSSLVRQNSTYHNK